MAARSRDPPPAARAATCAPPSSAAAVCTGQQAAPELLLSAGTPGLSAQVLTAHASADHRGTQRGGLQRFKLAVAALEMMGKTTAW